MIVRASLLVALLSASPVGAQERKLEQDPRGAVLCSYAMISAMEGFRRQCHPGARDVAAAFEEVLRMHRDFVRRNADWSDDALNAFEAQQGTVEPDICDRPDVRPMYQAYSGDLTRLRKGTETLLSVDRKPVWNPCL